MKKPKKPEPTPELREWQRLALHQFFHALGAHLSQPPQVSTSMDPNADTEENEMLAERKTSL